jgi:hypothetical protein
LARTEQNPQDFPELIGGAEENRTTQHALAQCWRENTHVFDDAIWRAPSKTRRIFRN